MSGKSLQEIEFSAWGLSKIAVRNIVVFFILTLLTAITTLGRVIALQNNQVSQLHEQLLQEKDKSSKKIEELKNETMKTIERLNTVLLNQQQIRQEIQDTKTTLKRVQKRIEK